MLCVKLGATPSMKSRFDKLEDIVRSYIFQISQIGTVVNLIHNDDQEGQDEKPERKHPLVRYFSVSLANWSRVVPRSGTYQSRPRLGDAWHTHVRDVPRWATRTGRAHKTFFKYRWSCYRGYFSVRRQATCGAIKPAPPVTSVFFGT